MARFEKVDLEVRTEVGVGQAENVSRFRDKTVQFAGTFVATVQLEGSGDGSAYGAIGAPIAEPGFLLVPQAVAFLRVRTLTFNSGAPRALFSGFDFRAQ